MRLTWIFFDVKNFIPPYFFNKTTLVAMIYEQKHNLITLFYGTNKVIRLCLLCSISTTKVVLLKK